MAQLDHIVLLLSTPDFENPPPWLSDNFTIIEGGTHTGQSSGNKLIFFKDGTYLELFNWFDDPSDLDDEKQPMRVWGQKKPGLIDFALTSIGSPEDCVNALNQRLEDNELGVAYQQPVPGGRKRADGLDVKWKVSRPKFHTANHTPSHEFFPGGRLDAPFFCHDITQRNARVLFDDEKATTHPCGASGISEVHVLVPQGELSRYVSLYKTICNTLDRGDSAGISIGTTVSGDATSRLVIGESEDISRIRSRGVGISDIVISTDTGDDSRKRSEDHGIGATVWLA
jgi:Glyoxalase-like domain